MNRRGMTLIEVALVLVIIGVMAAFAFPRIGDGLTRQSVRSARTMFIAVHARARATAIQRGAQTQLILNNNTLEVRSINPVSGAVQTVGRIEDLGRRYGVTVQPTSLTLTFDPRGIGMETAQTTISITKGAFGSTVVISPVGRVP